MTGEDADDIKDLLDQLDLSDEEAEEAEAAGANVEIPPEEMLAEFTTTKAEPSGLPIGMEDPGPLPAAPTQVIVVDRPTEQQATVTPAPVAGLIDVTKFVENYFQSHGEVIADCRSDRAEAQQVIANLQADIDAIKGSHGPQSVPRIYIEALVKAIEVKANINDTKVKMTDSGAKLIAALRSQINIQNNQTTIDGNLENILVRPLDAMTDEF